jgi:hypothetical protein
MLALPEQVSALKARSQTSGANKSLPTHRTKEDDARVSDATVNGTGSLVIKEEKMGKGTLLSQIVTMASAHTANGRSGRVLFCTGGALDRAFIAGCGASLMLILSRREKPIANSEEITAHPLVVIFFRNQRDSSIAASPGPSKIFADETLTR